MLLARLRTSRAIGLQMSHRQGGAKAEGDGSSLILVLWRRGSKKKRKTYLRTPAQAEIYNVHHACVCVL